MEQKVVSIAGSQATTFNHDNVKELSERFARLIKQLGSNNRRTKEGKTKDGKDIYVKSLRYKFEVDFAYALHEIVSCPRYLQGKMFDNASGIVNDLITHLKSQREEKKVA